MREKFNEKDDEIEQTKQKAKEIVDKFKEDLEGVKKELRDKCDEIQGEREVITSLRSKVDEAKS